MEDSSSTGSNGPNNSSNGSSSNGVNDANFPRAAVTRMMRKVLPVHAKITDEAKDTVSQCETEFITFITCEAQEKRKKEARVTLTAEDLIWAMKKLEMPDYANALGAYLAKYRILVQGHEPFARPRYASPPIHGSQAAHAAQPHLPVGPQVTYPMSGGDGGRSPCEFPIDQEGDKIMG